MSGLRRCGNCGVVMGGAAPTCPVCATPYSEPTSTSEEQVVLPRPPEVDLREAPAQPEHQAEADDLTTTSVGAGDPSTDAAHANKPVRTRPKTPLRPYVPPAPPQATTPSGNPANPFAPRTTTSSAPPLPSVPAASSTPGDPAAPPSTTGAPRVGAPVPPAGPPPAGPPPAAPPTAAPAAVGNVPPPAPAPAPQAAPTTSTAPVSTDRSEPTGDHVIEAPAWAALPPPTGTPFAGLAPPATAGPADTVAAGPAGTPAPAANAPIAPRGARLGPTAPPTPATQVSAPGVTGRPDPYAQISNPLHTGWGTAAPAAPPLVHMTPPSPASTQRRSPWVRRTIVVLVLALIAGALWWQRDRIGDAIDDLRGDEGAAAVDVDAAADGAATDGASPAIDPTDAYLEWERATMPQMQPYIDAWMTSSDEMVADETDLSLVRIKATSARASVQSLATLVDTAPPSQIRSDILSMLLNFMAGYDDAVRAIDTGDPAAADAVSERFEMLEADLERFAATHGTESVFLR